MHSRPARLRSSPTEGSRETLAEPMTAMTEMHRIRRFVVPALIIAGSTVLGGWGAWFLPVGVRHPPHSPTGPKTVVLATVATIVPNPEPLKPASVEAPTASHAAEEVEEAVAGAGTGASTGAVDNAEARPASSANSAPVTPSDDTTHAGADESIETAEQPARSTRPSHAANARVAHEKAPRTRLPKPRAGSLSSNDF